MEEGRPAPDQNASGPQRIVNRPGRYKRGKPIDHDNRVGGFRRLAATWSDEMAYVVGLIATDGCLSKDMRHITLTSGDLQLVETYLATLGRPIRYRTDLRGKAPVYDAIFSDVELFDWLLSVGLQPRKSLVPGAIDVPDPHLASLVRGLLDGDGTISVFTHAPTRRRYPNYLYERLGITFNSASSSHIEWLRSRLLAAYGVRGSIQMWRKEGRHDQYKLRYAKYASIFLLNRLYHDAGAPRLESAAKVADLGRLR
ncbi:MAG: hypothetical protein E6I20_05855 [Chloroflexi bacterium]|nr:MAG: hypothetical protein E6I20_05855 [Chloroflexota bacterium]